MKSTRKTYDTRYKLNNKLAWSTCKQQHQYIQIPFCSFSLICVDNFHRTSVSLSLSICYGKRSRPIKETYAVVVRANIYFCLAFLSSHTRAFVRPSAEEHGRWRCIGSGRRGGERVGSSIFLKACAYAHIHQWLQSQY